MVDDAAAMEDAAAQLATFDLKSGRVDMNPDESSELLRISLAVLMAEALELCRALE